MKKYTIENLERRYCFNGSCKDINYCNHENNESVILEVTNEEYMENIY